VAVSVGELLAYLRLDSTGFDRGIATARTEMTTAAGSATRMAGAVTESEAALTGAGRQANVAASGSAKFRAAQLSAVAAAERYNTVLQQEGASAGKLAAAEASVIRANERVAASTPRVASSVMAAGASAEKSGGFFASAASKAGSFTSSMGSMAGGLLVFGAAFKAVGLIKAGAEFQTQMLQIRTLTGGTTAEVKQMSAALLQLGPEVATGPKELATSLYHVESVGLRGAKALDVVKVAAQGAKVGTSDLEETTNALTSSVASGIKGVQNMQQAMGALTTIVGAGDMKMSDLNEALGTGILAVAKEYGVSLSDVGAVLATFGDNNIRGADAATALRMTMMAFAKPAAEGKAALDAIGLSTKSLAKDMESGGLPKAVDDLNAHMKAAGITGAKVGSFITEAFGKKAGAGLAVLMGQTDRFHTKLDDIAAGSGSFASKYKAATQTASFAFQQLGAEAQAAGVQVFQKLTPALTGAAGWLGTSLPHAVSQIQTALGPLEHEVGTALVVAWKALSSTLSVVGGVLSSVGGFLASNKRLVKDLGTAVLVLWGTFKGVALARTGLALLSGGITQLITRTQILGDKLAMISRGTAQMSWGMFAVGATAFALAVYEVGKAISNWSEKNDAGVYTMSHLKNIQDSYNQSLQATNGLIDENVLKNAGLQLQQSGVADKAAKAGISLQQLITGVTGNEQAFNGLVAAWKKGGDPSSQTLFAVAAQHALFGTAADSASKLGGAVAGVGKAEGIATPSITAATDALTKQQDPAALLAKAMGNVADTSTAAGASFLSALSTFSSSTGDAAAHAKLLGAGLVAMQGDALGFTGAMAGASAANRALTDAFAQQAQQVKANAKGSTLAYADTERAALSFTKSQRGALTASIDYTRQGAAPMIQQLQAMQTAAETAAEALYQHEVASKGAGKASEDAANIFKTDTYDALVKDAGQLGLTTGQAVALAQQYFNMPKDFSTRAHLLGTGDVVKVLDQIGQQLSFLTGHPWVSMVDANARPAQSTLSATKQQAADLVRWSGGNRMLIAANTSPAMNAIAGVRDAYDRLVQHTATGITVGGRGTGVQAHASGGQLGPGWNLVGEQGPELISPSRMVFTAPQTASKLSTAGSVGMDNGRQAKGGTTVNAPVTVYAAAGQSEYEIGTVTAAQLGWQLRTA
jgi:TP901 family phage tail tape measure protein